MFNLLASGYYSSSSLSGFPIVLLIIYCIVMIGILALSIIYLVWFIRSINSIKRSSQQIEALQAGTNSLLRELITRNTPAAPAAPVENPADAK